jgi:hypothetical protein
MNHKKVTKKGAGAPAPCSMDNNKNLVIIIFCLDFYGDLFRSVML